MQPKNIIKLILLLENTSENYYKCIKLIYDMKHDVRSTFLRVAFEPIFKFIYFFFTFKQYCV